MLQIKTLHNRIVLSIASVAMLAIIGYIDWHTGAEFSLSVFYLIPVAVLSFYKGVTRPQLIINSCIAAAIWYVAEVNAGREYSHFFFPLWEALAVCATFLFISFLIFKLKEEHKKLLESNKQLQQLNEEKNTFLGIAAHDLRSPIGAIHGFSQLLLNEEEHNCEEMHEIVGIISEAAEKSLHLISSLLDVSRIETGILNISPQTVNYFEFVKRNIASNKLLAQKKSIFINLETESEDIVAQIDPIYFDEVLTNLISNAVKYSHPNTVVTVRIEIADKRILTKVTDRGVGISEQECEKLFQPFQRGSSKPTQGESSTGLGLAIVKKIVLLHQGEVGITSKLKQGTTVFFYLPLQKSNLLQLINNKVSKI